MCSYCGCRESLPIIARWSEEHDEIVNALGQVRRAVAGGVQDEVLARTADLRALLDPHTASEERSMFAELRRDPEFTEVVDALCAEHVSINAGIARVEAGEPGAYDDLEHLLMRHIDKEENGLFPAAIMALDGEAWDRAVANA